jgi:HSP20 family molecular chaperone IbpA
MTTNTGKQAAVRQNSEISKTQDMQRPERAQSLDLSPAADIHETKDGAVIYLDLPGVSKDSLEINVDSDVLTIRGGLNLNTPHDLNPTYMDVHAGVYSRKFTLSAELDSSNIEANLKDGVLKLVIPRSEKHKPRKIEVKAA